MRQYPAEHQGVVIRILAWSIFCFAVSVLGAELLVLLETGYYSPLTLGTVWQNLHELSYIRSAEFLSSRLHELWDPVLLTILACPAWALLAASAIVLFMQSARRRR